jgi:hypothetical protein
MLLSGNGKKDPIENFIPPCHSHPELYNTLADCSFF